MTENQLFSMSTELFDTSSNSSNPLKYELYSLGLNTTLGTSALLATFANSNNPIPTSGSISISSSSNNSSSNNNSGSGNSIFAASSHPGNSGYGSGSGSSNVMLTNAIPISIPRSSNPNQLHNPYQDELVQSHHPSSSPFLSQLLHHQPQQSGQQLLTTTNPTMMSSSQQQQQQQSQQSAGGQSQQGSSAGGLLSASLADYSDYGLDALDASSLSPTLLQDVSLSAAHGHNSSGSVNSPFYSHDASSPLSHNGGLGHGGHSGGLVISPSTDITGVVTFLGASATAEDISSSLLYDANVAPNSNTMWSDISSAIATTKNERFTLEDDDIFPIDKSDIGSAGFGDLDGGTFLEDIGNLEDFLPSSAGHDGTSSFLLSPTLHSNTQTTTPTPGMGPPMELLQQQQQQQQMQQFSQLQTLMATSNSNDSGNGSNSRLQQQQQQQSSSSSPYEVYHSTPNKHQMHNANTFSPGSQSSHSPLQMNSITPPPPHANRSQFQQSQVKSRNMQELLKKEFSISPDRNNSSALLGHSVPGTGGLLMAGNALSPGSASSGFGSSNGANSSNASSAGGNVISLNSTRKQFYLAAAAGDANAISRLSSSAPTHLGMDYIWKRREPRQHLLSTGSLAEAESYSSLSTASVLSPDGLDYSQDDDDDISTDYNSDNYDDLSSDNGSDNDDDSCTVRGRSNSGSSSQLSSSKGKERFFWQYNVQAKGPKGKRLVFQSKLEDPHVLNEVTDPVFSPNCSVKGIKVYKHSGKARKGDGNDLTPNPRKLHNIGKELDRLSRTINDMTPVSELPFTVRPKSRKEKNKLASRACRLKKKAQHEANKIKLFGLEIEHKRLLNAIADIKQTLVVKYHKQNVGENSEEQDQQIENIYKKAIGGLAIAGGTTDFVNKVLDNVKGGQPSGGLEELRNT